MAKKVKITRKQIKQDDAFLATMKEVTGRMVAAVSDESFYKRYKKQLIIGGVAVVVVLAVVGGVFGNKALQEKGAGKLMAQADAVYRAPVVTPEQYEGNPAMAQALGAYTEAKTKWSAAAEKYDAVANEYPNTSYGILGLFYAANSYYELAEYAEAISRFEKYIEKAGAGAPFAPLARQSIGYAYEEVGKLDDAARTFLSLVKEENTTTAFLAIFDLARVYEKQNKVDEAIKTLQKVNSIEINLGPQYGKLKRKAQSKIEWLQATRKKDS